jgi:endonuclease YncB( thermonuclease family)
VGRSLLILPSALALAGCDSAVGVPWDSKGPAQIVAAGERFDCTPIKVYDGDGPIWCDEGPRVRLAGIAAREMDGTCRSNQPCPTATAEAARDHLARLVGDGVAIGGVDATGHAIVHGPTLSCRSTGSAGGKRTAAWCLSPRVGDLSCAMIASGLALRWDRYWSGPVCAHKGHT